ncbi:MAG: hypothetical protein PUE10_07030 [Bacteroidales bacterium]|nr:hypothetical protein [Bacteroidales bacterium]
MTPRAASACPGPAAIADGPATIASTAQTPTAQTAAGVCGLLDKLVLLAQSVQFKPLKSKALLTALNISMAKNFQ